MKTETITRIKLTASDGMVLTDGENYGKEVFLSDSEDPDKWNEITDQQYADILTQQEAEVES